MSKIFVISFGISALLIISLSVSVWVLSVQNTRLREENANLTRVIEIKERSNSLKKKFYDEAEKINEETRQIEELENYVQYVSAFNFF